MPNPSTVPARQLATASPAVRQVISIAAEQNRYITDTIDQIRRVLAPCDRLAWRAAIAMSTTDGWPTRNGEGGSSSGISDPVGAMVTSRAAGVDDAIAFRLTLTTALEAAKRIHATLTDLSSHVASATLAAAKNELCAASIAMNGYEAWGIKDTNGAPTECHNLPSTHPTTGTVDRGGLCTRCYQRRRHWQNNVENGFT